jgi:formate dehydrogenase major subunit
MDLTRRDFLKLSGSGLGAAALVNLGFTLPAHAAVEPLRISKAKEITGVCSFCAVGCGTLSSSLVENDHLELINVEGNPDCAINFGTLCSKGAAIIQKSYIGDEVNPERVEKPMYRAGGSTSWTEISWDEAADKIAKKMKDSRDSNWIAEDEVIGADGNPTGQKVPALRTETIGSVGSAELSNEGAYLLQKFMRALGVVYIEHHARL